MAHAMMAAQKSVSVFFCMLVVLDAMNDDDGRPDREIELRSRLADDAGNHFDERQMRVFPSLYDEPSVYLPIHILP